MKKLWLPLMILLVGAFILGSCSTAPSTTAPASIATTPTTTTSAKPATTQPPVTTTPAVAAPRYGGILKYATAAAPSTPIGWMPESFGASTVTMQLVMEFPLKESTDASLQAWLADTWEVEPANNSIKMTLKKGIKFGDGSDFNAQSIKWNFEQIKASPMTAGFSKYWKSIDVIDEYTFRWNYTEWQNRFLRDFADAGQFICSPAAHAKNGLDWMRWNMTGTGAFLQTDFQRDVVTRVRKNPTYWDKGLPYLDGIDLMYVVDKMTRQTMLKAGEADMIDLAGDPRYASDLKAAGYQIIQKPGGASVLWPDSANSDSPWANLKVRQAAEYAVDKAAIARTFGYGFWLDQYQLPTPASLAYNPNFSGARKFDVARAKQLLTEAGFPNGFKTTLYASTGANQDIPLAIKANLDAVGIETTVQAVDPTKFNSMLLAPWKNALIYNTLLEWPNFNNTINFYFGTGAAWFPSAKRPSGWEDMFNASVRAPQVDKALMQKCVQALYDDVTVINLYTGPGLTAATNKVRDTGLDKRSSIYWNKERTWLSQ